MPSWDDVAYFLETHRRGSLSAAARALGVNQTTVGRRLRTLEHDVGARLLRMTATGATLTEAGEAILPEAEGMERAMLELAQKARGHDSAVSGTVRIAAPEALAATFVIPRLREMRTKHPNLDFVVLAQNRAADLTRGEADLAVRLLKSDDPTLVARKVGEIRLAVFAADRYLDERGTPDMGDGFVGHDVLSYHGELATGLEARWLAANASRARTVFRANTVPNLMAAALAGMGIAVLPEHLAGGDAALRRLAVPTPPESRGVWIVYHSETRRNARIKAVVDELVARAREPDPFSPKRKR